MPGARREGDEGAFKAVVGEGEVEGSREMFCGSVNRRASWEKCLVGLVEGRR